MGSKWKTRNDPEKPGYGKHYEMGEPLFPTGKRRASGADLPAQTRSVDSMKSPQPTNIGALQENAYQIELGKLNHAFLDGEIDKETYDRARELMTQRFTKYHSAMSHDKAIWRAKDLYIGRTNPSPGTKKGELGGSCPQCGSPVRRSGYCPEHDAPFYKCTNPKCNYEQCTWANPELAAPGIIKPHIEHAGTIEDLQAREDLQLITDSQDVRAIEEHLGIKHGEFDGYFVKIGEGEYTEVYGFEGTVPELHKSIYKIEQSHPAPGGKRKGFTELENLSLHIGSEHPKIKIGQVAALEKKYGSGTPEFASEMRKLHDRAHASPGSGFEEHKALNPEAAERIKSDMQKRGLRDIRVTAMADGTFRVWNTTPKMARKEKKEYDALWLRYHENWIDQDTWIKAKGYLYEHPGATHEEAISHAKQSTTNPGPGARAPGRVGIKTIPGKFKIGDAVRIPGLSGIARVTHIRSSEDEPPKYKLAFRDGSTPKYFNESSIKTGTAQIKRETQDTNYYKSFPKDQFYIIRWLKSGGYHFYPEKDKEFPQGFSSRGEAEKFIEKWSMQDDSKIVSGSEAHNYGVPKRY